MKSIFKMGWLGLGAVVLASVLVLPQIAEAKRLGGAKNSGTQSSNVAQKAPPAASTAPAAAAAAAPAAGAAAAAGAARNKWLGPLAGLAAGLGIAALLSHMGMGGALGEMLGSFLMIAAFVLVAVMAFRWWKNRQNGAGSTSSGMGAQPAFAGFGGASAFGSAPAGPTATTAANPLGSQFTAAPHLPGVGNPQLGNLAGPSSAVTSWTIPAGFDTGDFLHIAKMYFVRLQAAWDAGNDSDIRTFTTPEMYAETKLELAARGGEHNQTDVVSLDAKLLGVEEQGETTLASVRLSGLIRETVGGPAEPFSEVWNLQKPTSARASWVLAGIQQE